MLTHDNTTTLLTSLCESPFLRQLQSYFVIKQDNVRVGSIHPCLSPFIDDGERREEGVGTMCDWAGALTCKNLVRDFNLFYGLY